MGKLKITLQKSTIGALTNQKETVRSLGLRNIRQTVEKDDNPMIRGMIFRVKHLVSVEEIQG